VEVKSKRSADARVSIWQNSACIGDSSSANEKVVCSTKGDFIMRLFTIGIIGLVCAGMSGLALANPSMLPKHPGYPSRGEFAYDQGQQNLSAAESLLNAAESENANIVQNLEDPNNAKQLGQEGAGLLPAGQAPKTKKELPAAEVTQKPKQ